MRLLSAGAAGVELVFFLLILAGRVFGPGFGFVLGVTSLFASALMTAGVGPWLPFQMLCAAWVGMGAGLLPRRVTGRWEIAMLAAYGVVAAYLFGALMNLSGWPFLLGVAVPGAEGDLTFDPTAGAARQPAHVRRLHAHHLHRQLRHRPRDHHRRRRRRARAGRAHHPAAGLAARGRGAPALLTHAGQGARHHVGRGARASERHETIRPQVTPSSTGHRAEVARRGLVTVAGDLLDRRGCGRA